MSQQSRMMAFVSYLLSLPGALYVYFTRREDVFATFHARQSLLMVAVGVIVPLGWIIIAWILAWVPTMGGMLAVFLFTLVIATYIVLIIDWVLGMIAALQGKARRTIVFGLLTMRNSYEKQRASRRESAEAAFSLSESQV